jgi:hypothetical protein
LINFVPMKSFITLICLLCSISFAQAQKNPCCESDNMEEMAQQQLSAQAQREAAQEDIESRKIAFISAGLSLTPAEAAVFWPVYNEWGKKIEDNMKTRHAALRQIRQLDKDKNANEKLYKEQTQKLLDGIAEEARLAADASKAYEAILGPVRTAKLYVLEDRFRGMLIRELRNSGRPQSPESPEGKNK